MELDQEMSDADLIQALGRFRKGQTRQAIGKGNGDIRGGQRGKRDNEDTDNVTIGTKRKSLDGEDEDDGEDGQDSRQKERSMATGSKQKGKGDLNKREGKGVKSINDDDDGHPTSSSSSTMRFKKPRTSFNG